MANFTPNAEMNFDGFPSNICEMFGKIPKEPISFTFSKVEVWFDGQCIHQIEKQGDLTGKVVNDAMEFSLANSGFSEYIKPSFKFEEISTNSNRMIWSKDIMNSKGLKYDDFVPNLVSLFYMSGALVKAAFNIKNQNTMVELSK